MRIVPLGERSCHRPMPMAETNQAYKYGSGARQFGQVRVSLSLDLSDQYCLSRS